MRLQHQPVGGDGDGADDQRRQQQRQEKAERGMRAKQFRRAPPGDDGAQHDEFAMRDIDHAHDAEDQRQTESGKRQDGGADGPFQQGEQQSGAGDHREGSETDSSRQRSSTDPSRHAALASQGEGCKVLLCAVSKRLRRIVGLRLVEAIFDGSGVHHLQLAAFDLRDELPAEALMRLAEELLLALRMLLAFGI